MSLVEGIAREYAFLSAVGRTYYRMRHVRPDARYTISDILEEYARKKPSNIAILYKDQVVTYQDLAEGANRYARWAIAQGVRKGDAVALLMANRPDYLVAWLGIVKLGGVVVLLNPNLRGEVLAHCIERANARHVIAGGELAESYASIWPHLETHPILWTTGSQVDDGEDLDAALAQCSPAPIEVSVRAGLTAGDDALLVYMAGSTDLAKATSVTHQRMLSMMFRVAGALGATAGDRMYNPLPLYHASGGICAVGVALTSGGSLVIRDKFVSSEFWRDCHRYQPTFFQYGSEICSHLLNTPSSHYERYHCIRTISGTGLRAASWRAFQRRFNIPRIIEFYSSADGNVAMLNYDGKLGAVGRVPRHTRTHFDARLIKFDVEAGVPLRNAFGWCVECEPGEAGEVVVKVHNVSDSAACAEGAPKKVLHNVFERDDAWLRTGDLMLCDGHGYFYFVDRLGDNFRWKGEVISCDAVAKELIAVSGILKAIVYGVAVPNRDGRAGMAVLVVDECFDVTTLAESLAKSLAPSARPYFLRLRSEKEVARTRKRRTTDLVRDGFDPSQNSDPIYWLNSDEVRYERLDAARYADIVRGRVRL